MGENKNNRWRILCNWGRTFACCKHERVDRKTEEKTENTTTQIDLQNFNLKYPKQQQHFDFLEHLMSGQ